MTNRLRPLAIAAAAGLALASGAALVHTSVFGEEPPDPITVGAILPLSGGAGGEGNVHRNALELALEQVNDRLADDDQLELRILDSRSNPGVAATNLNELAADPEVDAVITFGCPQCVVDVAAEVTVPVISLDGVDEVAAPAAERPWMFKVGPNPADNADQLSQAMAANDVATVGVIAADDDYGQAGVEEVRAAAQVDQLEVVTTALVEPGDEASVAAAADTLATWRDPAVFDPAAPAGPDAVVLWVGAAEAVSLAQALRDQQYQGPLFLDMRAAAEAFLPPDSPLQGARLVHTSIATGDHLIGTSPAAVRRIEFHRRYTSRYGLYDLRASLAADALNVIADAVTRVEGDVTRDSLRDRVESTQIDGLTGLIRMKPAEHSGLHPSSLLILQGSTSWR